MKTKLSEIMVTVLNIKRQNVQFILTLLAIALLVLGAGAPDNGGLVGR